MPNTTDAGQRRYRYGQQPAVAQWNLLQLANALYPLIEETKPLEDILGSFATHYESQWQTMMANKLGLPSFDAELTNRLLKLMTETETDMTLFFRHLADVKNADTDAALPSKRLLHTRKGLTSIFRLRHSGGLVITWLSQPIRGRTTILVRR